MSLLGPEAIADATIAYFNAFAAAKLTAIGARSYAVDMDIDPPKVIRLFDPFRAHEPDFPVWYVMPESTDMPTFKGGAAVSGQHRFVFAALVHHPGALDPDHTNATQTPGEMAGRLAMRHALAIMELLMDMSDATVSSTYYANGERVQWATAGAPLRARYHRFDPSEKGEAFAIAGVEAGVTLKEVV